MKLTIENINIICKIPDLVFSPLVLRPVRGIDNQGQWEPTMSLQFQVTNQSDEIIEEVECHFTTYDEQYHQANDEDRHGKRYIEGLKPRHKKSLFFLLEEFDENATCAELIIAEADSFAD
ncbi:MAG: hypothetical protein ACRBBR_12310 [Cellvibrionaceae bacterium]